MNLGLFLLWELGMTFTFDFKACFTAPFKLQSMNWILQTSKCTLSPFKLYTAYFHFHHENFNLHPTCWTHWTVQTLHWTIHIRHCTLKTTLKKTWEKTIFFTQASFKHKLFYLKKCVNCKKSELARKQCELYIIKKYGQNKTAKHL